MSKIREIKNIPKAKISEKIFRIEKIFIDIPIEKGKGGYPYSMFSLTDFVPAMTPDLVEDMADLIVYKGDFEAADIIVSEADRGGGPLTHAVAVRTGLPYTLANWYPSETKGQIRVKADVGFSGKGSIYLNGISKGQKAIFIDDMLSSGGTADALITAIGEAKAEILEAIFVSEKIFVNEDLPEKGRARLKQKHALGDEKIISLVKFLSGGKMKKTTRPNGSI